MDEELLEGTDQKQIAIGKPLEFSRPEFFSNLEQIINQEHIDELNIISSINSLIDTFIGKQDI